MQNNLFRDSTRLVLRLSMLRKYTMRLTDDIMTANGQLREIRR